MRKLAIMGHDGLFDKTMMTNIDIKQLVLNLNTSYRLFIYQREDFVLENNQIDKWKNAQLIYMPMFDNKFSVFLYDLLSVLHAVLYADIVFMYRNNVAFLLPVLKFLTNTKFVVLNKHVELMKGHRKLNHIFDNLNDYFSVYYSDLLCCTSSYQQQRLKLVYEKLFPVLNSKKVDEFYNKASLGDENSFVSLAMMNPNNKLEFILEIFKNLPNKVLTIIGNWNENEYGKSLFDKYHRFDNIKMIFPITDQRLLIKIFKKSTALIISNYQFTRCNTVDMAMSYKLPIIFNNNYLNRSFTEEMALYFGDLTELKEIITNTENYLFQSIGNKLYELYHRNIQWQKLYKSYDVLFKSLYVEKKQLHWFSLLRKHFSPKQIYQNGYAHLVEKKYFTNYSS